MKFLRISLLCYVIVFCESTFQLILFDTDSCFKMNNFLERCCITNFQFQSYPFSGLLPSLGNKCGVKTKILSHQSILSINFGTFGRAAASLTGPGGPTPTILRPKPPPSSGVSRPGYGGLNYCLSVPPGRFCHQPSPPPT